MSGPVALQTMTVALLVWMSGDAIGNCRTIYPSARVTERASDPRYSSCTVLVTDYSALLSDQGVLARKLRPAFEKKLNGTPSAELQTKLKTYDDKATKLIGLAGELSTFKVFPVAPAAPAAAAASASASASASTLTVTDGRRLLKDSKELNRWLTERIGGLESQVGNDKTAFCAHDFGTRILNELHAKVQQCF